MFFKYTRWALLWALFILLLCGIPGSDVPHISFLEFLSFDKFVHAGIFFVLILLSIRGLFLQTQFRRLQQGAKWISFVFCVSYGGLLEIMQGTLFEERSADVFDFIANSFGSALGLLLYHQIENKLLPRILK